MPKGIQEISVADDAAEDALVVAEEYEGELAGDCDGGTQAEAAAVPICFGEGEHYGCGVWVLKTAPFLKALR